MTGLKATWLCLCVGTIVLVAGCANHDDPAKAAAAPGVAPPAVVTPPAPMTLKPGMMERRRALTPPAGH